MFPEILVRGSRSRKYVVILVFCSKRVCASLLLYNKSMVIIPKYRKY